jgi:hypothetical protein
LPVGAFFPLRRQETAKISQRSILAKQMHLKRSRGDGANRSPPHLAICFAPFKTTLPPLKIILGSDPGHGLIEDIDHVGELEVDMYG